MKFFKNIRGDTIVEVLLAITIVSTVLGGAYASSNQSLNITRQAQERGESLKLAEEQLERLKTIARLNPAIFTLDHFCITDTLGYAPFTSASPDLQDFYGSTYPDVCKQTPQNGVTYYLVIQRMPDNTFIVNSTWPRAGGFSDDNVNLTYRFYPEATYAAVSGPSLPACPGSPGCVVPPPPPPPPGSSLPVVTLSADPGFVEEAGDRTTLEWTVSNADWCRADNWVGDNDWEGNLSNRDVSRGGDDQRVRPRATTTYRIECGNSDGTAGDAVRVEVGSDTTTGSTETGGTGRGGRGRGGGACLGVSTILAQATPGTPGAPSSGSESGTPGAPSTGAPGSSGTGAPSSSGPGGCGTSGSSSAPGAPGAPSAPGAPGAPSAPATGKICTTKNGVKTCTSI